jgi:dihydroorotase-like cyclic amidohydrolase
VDILVDGDRIRAIEPAGTLQDGEWIDCIDLIATPGLINSLLHSSDHFIKGASRASMHPR